MDDDLGEALIIAQTSLPFDGYRDHLTITPKSPPKHCHRPRSSPSLRKEEIMRKTLTALLITLAMLPLQAQCPATLNIFQTSLQEGGQPGTEISTVRLQEILAAGTPPVLDVRFPHEYAIS